MRQPHDIAFDDDSTPVPAVDFDWASVDTERAEEPRRFTAADVRRAQMEMFRTILEELTSKGDAKCIGQFMLVLAFISGATPFKTQKQLAKRMRVSPGRVSQVLNIFRRELPRLHRAICGAKPVSD